MLTIEHLSKYYRSSKGVEDLSITIQKGEIFGFIGPNGAGKSTTIRSIMHLIHYQEGSISLGGVPFNQDDITLKEKIGYLPSEIHLYDDFTVKEMLDYSASFYKEDLRERTKMLVDRLEIPLTKRIDELSLGNLKKVGIVLALMHNPSILILDEATSGLDPVMQEVFFQLMQEEKKRGTTIFFSSHVLSEIKRICDRVGIIKEGKLIQIEDMEKLRHSSLLSITITSSEIKKIVKELHLKDVSIENETIHFIKDQSIDSLLTILAKFPITKLLMEEPSIEEVFLHYYQ